MSCTQAEQAIIENIVDDRTRAHISTCESCQAFEDAQASVDALLSRNVTAPPLPPAFRTNLKSRIRQERVRAGWTGAADMIAPATGVVLTVAAASLIPVHSSIVWVAGFGFTAVAYLLHSFLIDTLNEG